MAQLNENNVVISTNPEKDRFRGWTSVLYPESMIPDWQDKTADTLQYPFVYIIHDKDTDKTTGELLKGHVHFGVWFNGPTTKKRALKLFQELEPSCAHVEPIKNVKFFWNYIIHNTDTCKKEHKHPYDPSERITGNGWNIEELAPMTPSERQEISIKLADYIRENRITNFADFYEQAMDTFGTECYSVIKADSYFLNCLIKGNFNKYERTKITKI